MADQELSKRSIVQDGGSLSIIRRKNIILHNNYGYEDMELDNPENSIKINKNLIISKIGVLLNREIDMLDDIKNSIGVKQGL